MTFLFHLSMELNPFQYGDDYFIIRFPFSRWSMPWGQSSGRPASTDVYMAVDAGGFPGLHPVPRSDEKRERSYGHKAVVSRTSVLNSMTANNVRRKLDSAFDVKWGWWWRTAYKCVSIWIRVTINLDEVKITSRPAGPGIFQCSCSRRSCRSRNTAGLCQCIWSSRANARTTSMTWRHGQFSRSRVTVFEYFTMFESNLLRDNAYWSELYNRRGM